jgi:predicted RNase H-like HicB family nuclease
MKFLVSDILEPASLKERRCPSMRRFTAAVTKEGDWYVAQCLELDVASQGTSVEEALENLKEALALYLEDAAASPRPTPIIAPIEVPDAAVRG